MKCQFRRVALLSLWMLPLATAGCFPDYPAPKEADGDAHEDVAGDLDGTVDAIEDAIEDAHEVATGETRSDVTDAAPDSELDTAEARPEIFDASDTSPEVVAETEVSDVAETAADTEPPLDTADDIADTADIADTNDAAEVEVDPCPGGCTHLDEACRVGVCGEAGCEAVDSEGACDDEVACTSDDRCEAGVCVGDAVVCVAKDDCHIAGLCNPSSGICSEPQKGDNSACDDFDGCTEAEACITGVCSGGVVPDDSGDWSTRAPATLGPCELVVDESGDLWWFVSLTETSTNFGQSPGGANIVLNLPAPSTFGVGVIRLDARGKPISAMLLAHSSEAVELPPVPSVVARIIKTPTNQALPIVVITAEGPTHFPVANGELTSTPRDGALLTFFAVYYNADGTRQNAMQIESESFGPIGDLKATNYPGISIGATGQVALAIPLAADKTAEVIGKESVRAGAEAVASTWFVKLSSGSLLWSRILEGTSPAFRMASSQVLSMDAAGSVWTAGWYAGTAHWRRATETIALDEIPDVGQGYGMFVGRIDSSARLNVTSYYYGLGKPFSVRESDIGGKTALTVALSGVLSQPSPSGPTPIFGVAGSSTILVLEFDQTLLGRTLRGTAGLAGTTYRQAELVALLGTTGEFGDGTTTVQVEAPSSLIRVPTLDTQWSVSLAEPIPTASNPSFIVDRLAASARGGFVVLGRANRGDFALQTSPSQAILEGESYLFELNSENGQVCTQR